MAKEQPKNVQSVPVQALYVVSVVIIILAICIGYLVIYEPAEADLQISRMSLASSAQELEDLRAKELEYNAYRKDYERLQARLAILQDKIPSTANELNHFLDSVNQRARSSRITNWTLFKQEGTIPDGEISRIPIRMEFTAAYDAALQFFWDLSSMGDGGRGGNREQLININDISMTRENPRGDASEPLVKVICVAETYLYTGKANQAAQQK